MQRDIARSTLDDQAPTAERLDKVPPREQIFDSRASGAAAAPRDNSRERPFIG
jgi:hypothetical protein